MQWIVLVKMREGVNTASELCQIMWHDTGALTRLLDQLEERGYVERQRSTADRRVVQLQLTAAGRRKTTELTPLVVDRLNTALGGFTKDRVRAIHAVVEEAHRQPARDGAGTRGGAMRIACSILFALLLAGCVLPQREEPNGTPIDQQALGLEGGAPLQPIAMDWWKALNDPQLDALMEEALRDSPSLAQALARVRLAQSRMQTEVAANQPRFAIDADETYQRFSENYYIPPPFAGTTMWIGQATANMHWDIDFWGSRRP